MTTVEKIFVNLPVKDLKKSIDFFTQLGFTFNPQFTDEKATCMILGENIFAMLLVEEYFKTFMTKPIADTKKTASSIIALSLTGKDKVDEIVKKAVKAGGTTYRDLQDYGWMYQHSFQDLDGHLWEVFYMNESQFPGAN